LFGIRESGWDIKRKFELHIPYKNSTFT